MSAPAEKRDISPLRAIVSPEYQLVQTSALPYAGSYVGPEGLQAWAEQMSDYFDVVDVQEPEIFEREGSNRIVVLANLYLRVRTTGEDLHFPFCQAVTVDLDKGLLTEMRPFYWDVKRLNEAVGFQP